MYQFVIVSILNVLSMSGTYIHFNKPQNMLKSNYTDLKVIHVDVPANVCKFYSVTGDQLATFSISDILKDGILVGEAGLSLHRAEDGFYILKFVDHPDFRDHSYYKLKPPILEVSVDKCQYKQVLFLSLLWEEARRTSSSSGYDF